MTAAWNRAIQFVLAYEGGYSKDPNDPGGETKFGISKKAYPNLDIENLSIEKAMEIYKKDYWDSCNCDDLPENYAIAIFDCAVNQGARKARRLLQMALDEKVDGIIGPVTIAAAKKKGEYGLMRFLAYRLSEYARIMIDNPKLERYSLNWCYRVIKLCNVVLEDPLD